MTRQAVFRIVRPALLACLVFGLALFGLAFAALNGSSSGSPGLAEEWRTELEEIGTPENAGSRDSRTFVIRFQTGEWVIARLQPSHGIWYRGGGTVVIHDSAGCTRAFFGHVCAACPNAIAQFDHGGEMSATASLEAFYEELPGNGFEEYHFK